MSEPEKKGSPWPWILVPIAAVCLFFALRQCRQSIPPANHAPAAAVSVPSKPEQPVADPAAAEPATAPAPAPPPQ